MVGLLFSDRPVPDVVVRPVTILIQRPMRGLATVQTSADWLTPDLLQFRMVNDPTAVVFSYVPVE